MLVEEDIRKQMTQRIIPPRGGSALQHDHKYHVQITEYTIVQWCERCPDIYILNRIGLDWDKVLRRIERE